MPSPEPKPAPVLAPAKVRNLTHESVVQHLQMNKQAAIAAAPPFEVIKVHLPEKDAKGNPVKDSDGFVKLVEKVVLKRDMIAAEWDEKIARFA